MKTRKILAAVLAVAVGCVLADVFLGKRPAAEKPPAQTVARQSSPTPIQVEPAPVPATVADSPAPAPDISEKSATASVSPGKTDGLPNKPQKTAHPKPPIQDPDARAALSFVGADSEAEAYWAAAINDPKLPANERKDLIEDLNEDGLSDAKHPGPQDLPLIVNRLLLIQELAPYAMDQVNADAFQEAQKDLLAMLDGRTVQ